MWVSSKWVTIEYYSVLSILLTFITISCCYNSFHRTLCLYFILHLYMTARAISTHFSLATFVGYVVSSLTFTAFIYLLLLYCINVINVYCCICVAFVLIPRFVLMQDTALKRNPSDVPSFAYFLFHELPISAILLSNVFLHRQL